MSKQFDSTRISRGRPLPLGVLWAEDNINFSIFSRHAEDVTLVLAPAGQEHNPQQWQHLALDPQKNRTGDIWHIAVQSGGQSFYYGYQIDGPQRRQHGICFFPESILLDPYCKMLAERQWGQPSGAGTRPLCFCGQDQPFDWQGDRPHQRPASELIIYELHVRGFTRHPTSAVSSPGTFRGLTEKIDHLRNLGITAVELLPVTAWDETDNRFKNPVTGEKLFNYWGYNPISFNALNPALASAPADCINEFKYMVREFHRAGIEIILDMVFNHTGETDYEGTTTSFRGIENGLYYLIDKSDGTYLNYSGCGNTVNCNHPVVRDLILHSLRYWVSEMHIDGFRFDLAAIFNRGSDGSLLEHTSLAEDIAEDPVLRDARIIAEAWDASGLYQVGSFSKNARWQEWNGLYRDDIRRFMSGHPDTVKNLATRIAGSSDLYQRKGQTPLNSINFVTSHDGFTLLDLVSFNEKNNHANGENNNDGENHNFSWNSGREGLQVPEEIQRLRLRRIRTFTALLLLSQGIPMITAGDEMGRTQHGNNNTWCQDNETNWLNWELAEQNPELIRFFQKCIALRRNHAVFRRNSFFSAAAADNSGNIPEIIWQSLQPNHQEWSADCRTLGFTLVDTTSPRSETSHFVIMINGDLTNPAPFILPDIPLSVPGRECAWFPVIDTAAQSPDDCCEITQAIPQPPGSSVVVAALGLVVCQSSPGKAS